MLPVKPCRKRGVMSAPIDQVSAISGARCGLPPCSTAHWPATHCAIVSVVPPLPYSAAVTPVCMHWASVAVALALIVPFGLKVGAQGSTDTALVLVTDCGVNASRMLA